MKKLQNFKTFDSFVNENYSSTELTISYNGIDILLEAQINDYVDSLSEEDLDEEYVQDLARIIEELDEMDSVYHSIINEGDTEGNLTATQQSDLEYAKTSGKRSGAKKVVNAIGWLAFPYISVLRFIYKKVVKKLATRRILAKETDPIRKEKLRAQLKDMSRQQVKAYEELDDMKKEVAKKKDEVKSSGKVKELPAGKREELVVKAQKQKEEVEKLKSEIKKVKVADKGK